MPAKLTTEKFIQRSIAVHGTKYSYEKSVYTRSENKIIITCPEHGDFEQQANVHYSGFGCPKCSTNLKANTETFKEKAFNAHGDLYDYSLVDYKTNKIPVKIICKIHGIFEQRPDRHINCKDGCLKCKHLNMYSNTNEFIQKANKIHNNKFDYSKVDYKNNKSKVEIICPNHGSFYQSPQGHLEGYGCIQCNERKSKPELIIEQFLIDKNISYESEKRFDDCKNIFPLPFDFYIPEYNTIIEYDGKHHYKPIECWGGEETLSRIQNNDNIKNNYCIDNNINLIRIDYTQDLKNELNKLDFYKK